MPVRVLGKNSDVGTDHAKRQERLTQFFGAPDPRFCAEPLWCKKRRSRVRLGFSLPSCREAGSHGCVTTRSFGSGHDYKVKVLSTLGTQLSVIAEIVSANLFQRCHEPGSSGSTPAAL